MPRTPENEHIRLASFAEQRGLPGPPARPVPGQCCNRGCVPCVWNYYERALEQWRKRTKLRD